jgi:hypothetical protein
VEEITQQAAADKQDEVGSSNSNILESTVPRKKIEKIPQKI